MIQWITCYEIFCSLIKLISPFVLVGVTNFSNTSISRTDGILCPENPTLSLSVLEDYQSYQWSTGDTLSHIEISSPGEYYLTVTDYNGCTAIDTINIDWQDNCDCQVYLPEILRLSSVYHNDQWQPISNCLLNDYDLKIYNKWGNMIFHSTDQSQYWKGIINGQPAEQGVYFYLLSYDLEGIKADGGSFMLMW